MLTLRRSLHVRNSHIFNQTYYRFISSPVSHKNCKPILTSSQLVYANNYDIYAKETSNILTFKSHAPTLHSLFISGGWLLPKSIDHNQLNLAIQNSLNVFPWISSRITSITNTDWTLNCNNQGVKLNIVCHPHLSIQNSEENKSKYINLQQTLKPYNRNIFFTNDSPHYVNIKNVDKIPVLTIQLNYLNTKSIEDIGNNNDGCIITFKLNHGFGDGYTGYLYMKYISDFLAKNSLSKYDNLSYKHFIELDDDAQKELTERYKDLTNFERKYNFHEKTGEMEIFPYVTLCRQTRFQMILTTLLQKLFVYFVSFNMDYVELNFSKTDINEIKELLNNELNKEQKCIKFTTYEALTCYLSLLTAKYESSTKKLKKLLVALNLRNRTTHFNENNIGNCSTMLGVGLDANMEYKASNFAVKLNDCLNRFGRAKQNEELTNFFEGFTKDLYVVITSHSFKYGIFGTVMDQLRMETVLWNEFRSLKLYESYRFGLDEKPLYYMYGTHYTGNRFMLLDSPNGDELRVFIRMPKGKLKKFRQNEKEFFEKYELKGDLEFRSEENQLL